MKRTLLLVFLSLLLGIAGQANGLETIYVVRHADKVEFWPKDRSLNAFQPLSGDGVERADLLAKRLRDARIAAIYSSATTRTVTTGMPLTELTGAPISTDQRTIVTAQMPDFLAAVRERHADDPAILVVGHSNTVPHLLIALGAQKSCWARLDIADDDGELLISGYEGLWKIELATPGCEGIERLTVTLPGADDNTEDR